MIKFQQTVCLEFVVKGNSDIVLFLMHTKMKMGHVFMARSSSFRSPKYFECPNTNEPINKT